MEPPTPEPPLEPAPIALRVGRAFPTAVVRGLGGAGVMMLLGMGLAATGWFTSREAGVLMLLDCLAFGACFGLVALLEAACWGPLGRPSRVRLALTAVVVWAVAFGVSWLAYLETYYFENLVVEGLGPEQVQALLTEYIQAVRDDPKPWLVINAMLAFPFVLVSLSDGCRVPRWEQAALVTLGATIPALPICFGNPMFEGGVNPDPGFQFLLVAGTGLLIPAVGKLSDWRAKRQPARFPDHAFAWVVAFGCALTTPFVWGVTRVEGDSRLNYYIVSALRLENAQDALEAGDYVEVLRVCKRAEDYGAALYVREDLRNCWLEATWICEAPGGGQPRTEAEHAWVATLGSDPSRCARRARSRMARGNYVGALADVETAFRLPAAEGDPTHGELWLLRAEIHATAGDHNAASQALKRVDSAAYPPPAEEEARVRALLNAGAPAQQLEPTPGAW